MKYLPAASTSRTADVVSMYSLRSVLPHFMVMSLPIWYIVRVPQSDLCEFSYLRVTFLLFRSSTLALVFVRYAF